MSATSGLLAAYSELGERVGPLFERLEAADQPWPARQRAVLDPDVVLVTARSFGTGRLDLAAELAAAGLQVVRGDPGHDLDGLDGLAEPLGAAVAWISRTGPVTAAHLDAAPRLQVLARYGTGVEQVDLAAAASRGIAVTSAPGASAGLVADHTVRAAARRPACATSSPVTPPCATAAGRPCAAASWPA